MKRPNIVLLLVDQHRWDALGAAGNELIHTPTLDRLAEQGTLFRNVFANCPVCMPSRMSLLSGRYPASLRIAANGIEMDPDIPCVQHILAQHDYVTANIGKLHFRNHASYDRDHRDPHPPYGFHTLLSSDEPGCYDDAYTRWVASTNPDALDDCRVSTPPAWTGPPVTAEPRNTHEPYVFRGPEELTHSAFVAEETAEFITRHRHDRFFCVAGFYAPHTPVNPPQRFVDLYDESEMPLPRRNEGENFEGTTDAQWRKTKAYYYALISHVDDQIGKIVASLEENGILENTVVIFTSDHGENLGDHGRVQKHEAWDSSARVPLIIRVPGSAHATQRPREADGIVELVDLAPTILDYAGVPTPRFMAGHSLAPVLSSAAAESSERDGAYIEYRIPYSEAYKALRTHDHLYVIHNTGDEELYDLRADPDQLANVAAEPDRAPVLAELRRRLLDRWFESEGQEPVRSGPY